MKILADNLKYIRTKLFRLSQEKFAVLLNSNRGKISSYERKDAEPSIAFMIELEKQSKIPIRDIYETPLHTKAQSLTITYPENKEIAKTSEEEMSYTQAENELNTYHLKLSSRLKKIEERLDRLEDEK